MNSHSPFKYLYSYSNTKEDYQLFFGRKKEIESVKKQLSKTKFLIVYGPSGSGKTSLLNAGILYPQRTKDKAALKLRFNSSNTDRFEEIFDRIAEDWNLNLSKRLEDLFNCKKSVIKLERLQKEIKDAYLENRNSDDFDEENFARINDELDKQNIRFTEISKDLHKEFIALYQELNQVPILILDQFEEIFIFHNNSGSYIDDMGILFDILLSNNLPVKIFLFIRSDYFGHLIHLERHFPKVFYPKVLVDMPNRETLKEITTRLFKEFNISTNQEDGSEIDQILDNIRIQRSDEFFEHADLYFLPYLQIYLDALYKRVFEKTYPNDTFNDDDLKEITISHADLLRIGRIDKVLMNLVVDVNKAIQDDSKYLKNKDIRKRIRDVKLPGTILLKKLVSAEKTKKRIYYSDGKFEGKDLNYLLSGFGFDEISREDQQNVLDIMLDELETSRLIIRNRKEEYLELTHDSLAEFVDTIVVDKDEHELLVRKFVADYELHKSYEKDNVKEKEEIFLDKKTQDKIGSKETLEEYFKGLDIEMKKEYKTFWKESRYHNEKKERIREWIRIFVFCSMFIGLLVCFYFLLDAQVANREAKNATKNTEFQVEKSEKEGKLFRGVGSAYGAGKYDRKSAYDSLYLDPAEMTALTNQIKDESVSVWDVVEDFFNGESKSDTINQDSLREEVLRILNTDEKYTIRRQYFEDLEGNLDKRPFYINNIDLPDNHPIETTKSRDLNRSKDTICVYALTHDYLLQTNYDLLNDSLYFTSKKLHGNIPAFEPFYQNDSSRVLVSRNDSLIVLNDSLKIIERTKVGKRFGLIEKIGGNKFLCLTSETKELFTYDFKNQKLSKYYKHKGSFYSQDIILISYLKNPKELFFQIRTSSNEDKIFKLDSNGSMYGLEIKDINSIKKIKVQKNGEILISDASSIYKIKTSDINEKLSIKKPSAPLLVHGDDENWEIRTIDSEGDRIIVGTQGNIAQIYYNEGNTYKNAIRQQKLIGHRDNILNVSFFGKGDFVLTSSYGGSIKIWDISDKSIATEEIETKNNGISRLMYRDSSLYVGFRCINDEDSDDSGYILELDENLECAIQKYYYRGFKFKKNIELPSFDFADDGSIAAGTFWSKSIRNAQPRGSKVSTIKPETNSTVRDIRIQGAFMAVGTDNGIELFKKDKGKYYKQNLFGANEAQINAVDIDLESERIIAAGEDANIYIWNLNDFKLDTILHEHHDRISDVCFSPDGKYFVSGSWDNKAIVWQQMEDSVKYVSSKVIKVHGSDIEDIAISNDNIIATASSDNTVQLHKVYYGDDESITVKRLTSLISHSVSIRAVSFGENSDILYTGDKEGRIKKWDRNEF